LFEKEKKTYKDLYNTHIVKKKKKKIKFKYNKNILKKKKKKRKVKYHQNTYFTIILMCYFPKLNIPIKL